MTPDDEQYRRSILARSRNYLLGYALRNQEWVLWLDVDIVWVRFQTLALNPTQSQPHINPQPDPAPNATFVMPHAGGCPSLLAPDHANRGASHAACIA